MQTIPDVLARAADARPDAIAVVDGEARWTFAELAARVRACAAGMIAAGLQKGDRFAVWAPNSARWIAAAVGGQMAGGVLVPLNTRFKGAEAADILRRAGCRLLFTTTDFLETDYPALLAGEDLPALEKIVTLSGDAGPNTSFERFLIDGEAVSADETDARAAGLRGEDLADIIFTSGTTGAPKGAMTSHAQNVEVFRVFSDAIGLGADDRYLIVNPFFHSFGYKAGWLAALIAGARIYPVATFDIEAIADLVEAARITTLPGPPTIFQSLLALPAEQRAQMTSLRIATTGAAMIPTDLVRRMKDDLHFDEVFTAYGLTESTGVVSLCRKGDDPETIATTCGRAMPGVEVRIMAADADASGSPLAPGEAGEIWVRGFNVMQGYLDDAEASAVAITPDGWLRTGDIGVMDARGYLKITDRKKDMFIVGGFNCYPAEIERLLMQHPDVVEAAVKGAPDPRLGEVAHAFVVRRPGATLDAESLIEWARAAMANYKAPRRVDFVDALPRNASGKVQKFLL